MQILKYNAIREKITIDRQQLSTLLSDDGSDQSEELFFDTVEAIAQTISRLETQFSLQNLDGMCKSLSRIRALSLRSGFNQLSQVATDAEHAIMRNDRVALSAIIQRIIRVSEGSLMAVWDVPLDA